MKKLNVKKLCVSIVLLIALFMSIFNIYNVIAKEELFALTDAVIESKSDTAEATITSFDDNKVLTDIVFHKLNDEVSYKLTVKNNSENDVTIKDISDDNSNPYVEYEYDKHVDETVEGTKTTVLFVKAIYKNEASENTASTGSTRLTLTLEEVTEENGDEVPQTGDNIYLHVIVLIISLTGLILVYIKNKNLKKAMVLIVLFMPIVVRALTVTSIVEFKGEIKIQDRQTVKTVVEGEENEQVVPYGTVFEKPADPEKVGYNFIGWYKDGVLYDFNTPVTNDVEIEAKFEAKTVTYNVIHKQQNIDNDEYTEKDTEPLEGKYDEVVTVATKDYEGFTAPEAREVKLGLNTEVVYEYVRNSYDLTYKYLGTTPDNAPELPNGGNYKYGATVTVANNPTLAGYEFSGWSRTGTFEMPAENVEITGAFTAVNSDYKVEHYGQNIENDEYTLMGTDNLSALTDTNVVASTKTFTGFTYDANNSNNVKTGKVNGNGTLVLKLYYTRNTHSVSYTYTGTAPAGATALPANKTYKYGATVTVADAAEATGYTFSGWSKTNTFTMPDEDVEITGAFTPNGDTPYTIEYYGQNITDNGYTKMGTDPATGATDADATANPKEFTGFTFDENNTNNVQTGTISSNGDLVLKLYYKRNTHTVTYSYTGTVPASAPAVPRTATYKYGATITVAENPTLAGYEFSGWSKTGTFTLPDENVEITGSFTAVPSAYKVEHYGQNIENNEYTIMETENLSALTDTDAEATAKTFEGFTYDENNTNNVKTGKVNGNGTLVLKLYYTRNTHTVTYAYTGTVPASAPELPASQTYKYEATVTVANNVTVPGYEFSGWSKTGTFTMPDENVEITGSFTAGISAYTVETYYQQNGAYGTPTSEQKSGETDTTATLTDAEMTPNNGYVLDETQDNVFSGTINGNGTLVLKIYFKQQFSVTYKPGTKGQFEERTINNLDYGSPRPNEPTVTGVPGYTHAGWDPELTDVVTANAEYTALWTPNSNTAYKVEYYGENLTDSNYSIMETVNLTGETDTEAVAEQKTFEGFTFDSSNNNNVLTGNIDGEGSLVLKVYYIRNGHEVTYSYTGTIPNGATELPTSQTYKYEATVTVAPNATAPGYEFNGWSKTDSFTMPDEDVEITGSFTAVNSAYKVEHYGQNVDNNDYTLMDTENLSGLTDTTATATDKTFAGFTYDASNANNETTGTINGNGTLVLKVYYLRNTHTVSYAYTGTVPANAPRVPASETYRYEATVTVAGNPTLAGYEFGGWNRTGTFTMPDENVEITGSFTAVNSAYKVEHYGQNIDNNNYTLMDTDNLSGLTDTTATASDKDFEGFTYDPNNNNNVKTGAINGNGTLVLKLYYTRNTHTVTYSYTGTVPNGASAVPASQTYKYGATVTVAQNATAPGYTFNGWSKTNTFEMPDEDVAITGSFTPGTSNYKVEHYTEKLDGTFELLNDNIENLSGTTDTEATAVAKTIEHYEYDENNTNNVKTGTINGNGTLVLKLYYKLDTFTITLNANGGESVNPIIKKYGETLTVAEIPSTTKRHGALTGWYTEAEGGTQFNSDITITSDKEYFAHWDLVKVCKKAIVLHTETCERLSSSDNGCYSNGYYLNGSKHTRTIVYGNTAGSTPVMGDAYDCDVNNDGIYDPTTERFYYIKTEGDNVSLIFYSNFEGEDGVKTTSNWEYEEALTKLPTFEQWPNIDVEFDGKAARLLYLDEAKTACGVQNVNTDKTTTCDYVLENSSYHIDDLSLVRSGIWLHKSDDHNDVYRIQTKTREIYVNNTSKNVTRPVIEVPTYLVDTEDLDTYTVTYDLQGGSLDTPNILVLPQGSAIRELPLPTQSGKVFAGWFTDTNYDFEVTLPVIVNENKTYYAKWSDTVVNEAMIGTTQYTTLAAAIQNADTHGAQTTIKLLKDVTANITLNGNRDIILDLNNHEISNVSGKNVFIIKNTGKLEVKNGTLSTTDNVNGLINVETGGVLTVSSGANLVNNGGKQCVYNDGGTVYINEGSTLSSTTDARATVHNKTNGTMYITGGTITSDGTYAVYNENGTLEIGVKDQDLKTNTPVIEGVTYGLVANSTYKFYDGIIKGETFSIGATSDTGNTPTITDDTTGAKISEYEDDTELEFASEMDGAIEKRTLSLAPLSQKYRITLDAGEGEITPGYVMVTAGSPVGPLPNPTNGTKEFLGWYLTADCYDEDLVASTRVPEHDETYYAKWKEEEPLSMICWNVASAAELHVEKCDSTGSCVNAGYQAGDDITYGTLVTGGELKAGDALDCDVNNNGQIDVDANNKSTERFYYLTDDGTNASLIFYEYFDGETGQTGASSNLTAYLYPDAQDRLPSTTQWSNVPVTFANDRAARFITLGEVKAACGITSGNPTNEGDLNNCQFLFEQTKFRSSDSRTAIWIELQNNEYYRIMTDLRSVNKKNNTSQNTVRPVILIPLNQIDLTNGKVTVTFDPNGGTVNPTTVSVNAGETINPLPTPTYTNYVFNGWFTRKDGGTELTTTSTIDEEKTVYAHWLKSVKLANINVSDVILTTNETQQITVAPDAELENYSFSSSDTNVATVNSSGLVTAKAAGTTTIVITGAKSTLTRTINVTVTNLNVVTFNPTNSVMQDYYSNVDTWKANESTFEANMISNFNAHSCKCGDSSDNDNKCTSTGTVLCDKPNGYDTGTNTSLKVYLYDVANNTRGSAVTYAKATNGIIYNLIPNQVYYWEAENNSAQNGYVRFTGERRIIDAGDVLNTRDLGGLKVDSNGDGVIDGTIKYGVLFRGKLLVSSDSKTELENLGINEELDLRGSSSDPKLDNYVGLATQNYIVSPYDSNELADYNKTRAGVKRAMQDVIAGKSIYFHCRIGTDRTGTLAYILEGLLGVSEEDRVNDYELSFFSGLVNRHRYYSTQSNSSISKTRRFVYLHNLIPTNEDIYDWYMAGTTSDAEREAEDQLISDFKDAIIDQLSS